MLYNIYDISCSSGSSHNLGTKRESLAICEIAHMPFKRLKFFLRLLSD